MASTLSSLGPRLRGLLPLLALLTVTMLPEAAATVYRTEVDPDVLTFEADQPVRLTTRLFAETYCEAYAAEPVRLSLTGLPRRTEDGNATHAVLWTYAGAPLEPDDGTVEVPWTRPQPLVPHFVANATFHVDARRNPDFAAAFSSDRAHWSPNPFVALGTACPGGFPKLEGDRLDMEQFRLHGEALVPDPETDGTPDATTAGPSLWHALAACVFGAAWRSWGREGRSTGTRQ